MSESNLQVAGWCLQGRGGAEVTTGRWAPGHRAGPPATHLLLTCCHLSIEQDVNISIEGAIETL